MNALLISFAILSQSDGLDFSQFRQLLKAQIAPIHDVELICEGEVRYLNETDPEWAQKASRVGKRFQANYAYREDGATYWDIYRKPFDSERSISRTTAAILKGKLYETTRSPDQNARLAPVSVENGGPMSLHYDGCPERFMFLWLWHDLMQRGDTWGFTFEGFEDVEGHRCARLLIDKWPEVDNPTKYRWRYWVDLERGGHALREEILKATDVAIRVQHVELVEIDLPDGRKVWFPGRGEVDAFYSNGHYLKTPVARETYQVLQGSLLFNQGLKDERFSVNWTGRKVDSTEFARSRREFATTPAKPGPPPLPSDPAGIERYQKEKLAEAEQQARQLESSPPSERTWNPMTLVQAVLGVGGFAVLIGALAWRRRSS